MGCVGARAGRGVPGPSQAVPGDDFLKGIWYQNGSPRKGAQSAKVLIFIAFQRLYPFLAGGKRKISVVGFWAIWAPFEHLVAVLLMSAAWALEFWAPGPTDPIVCANIWGREVSERTLIGKLISSNSPLGNFAFPKRTSFPPQG